MKKNYFICLLVFLSVQFGFAQIESFFYPEGNAKSAIKTLDQNHKAQKLVTMPSFDAKALIEEDRIREESEVELPYRFGKAFDVNTRVNLNEDSQKSKNGKVWSREFYSEGALSINFVLENLQLAEGAEMYLYNDSNTMIYGPVTSKNNNKEGIFLTDLIFGDRVTIYVKEPANVETSSTFTIKRVVHAYRGLNGQDMTGGTPGASEGCNNEVACFLAQWQQESRSVALILLANGNEHCSGCLVNTTDQSMRPFFLTAFHCADSSGNDALSTTERNNAEDWMYKFGFRRVGFTGSTLFFNWSTTNGATFRAGWGPTDFLLMELDNLDDENHYSGNIAFAGWDRRANTPTSGASIHHPAGDLMKISIENNAFQTSSWGGTNNHWRVNFDDGVVQHGSSGSPIFNQNRRVVGQLHGNQTYNRFQTYCSQPRGEYGRFNVSWNGGGTNATRLRNWLDPCGTGANTTNTLRGPYMTKWGTVGCTTRSYQIYHLPAGATVTWSSSSNLTRTTSQGVVPASYRATGTGSAWVRATITMPGGCGNNTSIRTTTTAQGASTYIAVNTYGNSNGWVSAYASGGTSPYTWTIYGNGGSTQVTTTSSSLYHNIGCGGGFIQVSANNTCGVASYGSTSVPGCSSGGGPFPFAMRVYPNPATDRITIERINQVDDTTAKTGRSLLVETATFYDFAGIAVKSVRINKGDKVQLDVTDLKAGHYFLKLTGNGVEEMHKIIIK
jgi:hypothetical protein